jgi:hypothetical protein
MPISTKTDSLEVLIKHRGTQLSKTDSTMYNAEPIFATHVDSKVSNKEFRLFGVLLWRYTKISTISERPASSVLGAVRSGFTFSIRKKFLYFIVVR